MREAYYEVFRNLVFRAIQRETRLSERQVAQLRWSQIHNDEIVTAYRRHAKMSRELVEALNLLPRTHSLVFFGSSLAPRQDSEAMRELRRQFEEEDQKRAGSRKIFAFTWGGRALTK